MDHSAYGYDVVVEKRGSRRHRHPLAHINLRGKLETLTRVSEVVLISLFLLSNYSPVVTAAVKLSSEFLQRIVCLSSKPLHVFLISNAIILAIAVLSSFDAGGGRSGGKVRNSGGTAAVGDVYEEYLTRRRTIVGENTPEAPVAPAASDEDKQIVLYSLSGAPAVEEKTALSVNVTIGDGGLKSSPRNRVTGAEKFTDLVSPSRRRRSSLAVRKTEDRMSNEESGDGVVKSSPRKRTMETEEPAGAVSPPGRGTSLAMMKTVEDMSNEEFNRRVERYIARTRRLLQVESMRDSIASDWAGRPQMKHCRSF